MPTPEYSLNVSLTVLEHLGFGLYSNTDAVLAELVANAWDAGATRVDIVYDKDRMDISDNGRGMTRLELNERFLKVGYQKRHEETTITVEGKSRHVMGRKGIGKLAAFSVANRIELRTACNGENSGFVMVRADIQQAIDDNASSYVPIPISAESINIQTGTKFSLLQFRQPEISRASELRTAVARRFSVIDGEHDFDVYVNGVPVTLNDKYYDKIQFMWYLGASSQRFVARCPDCIESFEQPEYISQYSGETVSGWIGTIPRPKAIDAQHRTISIFAHGKLIQEDILAEIQEDQNAKAYIVGEVYADFMDEDDAADIVTSDRQRIRQTDPRYGLLKAYVEQRVKAIASVWSDVRAKHGLSRRRNAARQTEARNGDTPTQLVLPTAAPLPQVVDNNAPAAATLEDGDLLNNLVPSNGESSSVNGTPVDGVKPLRPPSQPAQNIFGNARALIKASKLEHAVKSVVLADLREAELAYNSGANKACVILLGAAIEGLMLGALRKSETIHYIREDSSPPDLVTSRFRLGFKHPNYATDVGFAKALCGLEFEDLRTILEYYMPLIKDMQVIPLQRFRNAVHPGRNILEPDVYEFDYKRALEHITSFGILTPKLLDWTPKRT